MNIICSPVYFDGEGTSRCKLDIYYNHVPKCLTAYIKISDESLNSQMDNDITRTCLEFIARG